MELPHSRRRTALVDALKDCRRILPLRFQKTSMLRVEKEAHPRGIEGRDFTVYYRRQPFARLSMPLLWCKSGNAN